MLAILVFLLRILILLALFSFVGWTVYTLWRDLKFQSQSLTTQKVPHISVYQENDPASSKLIYTRPELQIGRDPACDIQINDDTVSNHHARLVYKNKQWWIEDLLSTNGTFLNDERIETPTILISGDELRVGKISLVVEIQPFS
jgi:pSer/pThr/pTyr-binding forkhead associated (FHA) protein